MNSIAGNRIKKTIMIFAFVISGNFIFSQNVDLFSTEDNNFEGFEVSSPLTTAHKILGYTTFAAGVLTGFFNPEVVGLELHQNLAYSTAALSGITLGLGYLSHAGSFESGFGIDSTNVHIVLGIAGASMMMITPFVAPEDIHSKLGELGTALMGASILFKIAL